MGRSRSRMEMIGNKKERRLTFERRRKGLEKKAQELSTLCGVRMCFIIFGPSDCDKTEPKIWPENPSLIASIIDYYMKASPRERRSKDQTKKADEHLAKLRKKNPERPKFHIWDERYDSLSIQELRQFDGFLKGKLEDMKARVEFMKGTRTNYIAETIGSAMNGSSSYDPKQEKYGSRCQSAQFDVSFDPNKNGSDLPFLQSSYNYNVMANRPMMLWMNNGANPVISYHKSDNKSPPQFNKQPAAECISSFGNDAVENQCYYYIPVVQTMPLYMQYPLQQSRDSTQIADSQTAEKCYE